MNGDDLFLKSEEIHVALENLKGRANFSMLLYNDRLIEVEYLINSYRSTQLKDYMDKAMAIFESLKVESVGASPDTTIWNASILVRSRKRTLGEIFEEASKLL